MIARVLLAPFEKATIANVDNPVPSQSSSLIKNRLTIPRWRVLSRQIQLNDVLVQRARTDGGSQRRCDADLADSSTWAFASGRGSMAPSCGGSKARERCGTWSLLKLQKCHPHGQQHGVATRRAAALLAATSVGSTLTARCGDARASPPWPRPKSLAAGPLSILNTLLEPPIDFAYPVRVNAR